MALARLRWRRPVCAGHARTRPDGNDGEEFRSSQNISSTFRSRQVAAQHYLARRFRKSGFGPLRRSGQGYQRLSPGWRGRSSQGFAKGPEAAGAFEPGMQGTSLGTVGQPNALHGAWGFNDPLRSEALRLPGLTAAGAGQQRCSGRHIVQEQGDVGVAAIAYPVMWCAGMHSHGAPHVFILG